MLLKENIAAAYKAQNQRKLDSSSLLRRTYLEKFKPTGQFIEVISGIRRCGKSTLMSLIANDYPQCAYFNFEDARVYGFEVSDFPKLREVAGEAVDAYFFDEIQNVTGWEVFVRQLHEEGKKVFITGSNASLLSKELGTRLTGRHIRHELFPFSYLEFLQFKELENNASSFEQYVERGGFPEFLQAQELEILQNLLQDIVLRDIAIRHGIRNTHVLMQLTLYLLSNTGKEISYNSLRKTFDIGSPSSVSDYLNWLEDSYLLQFLPRFSYSTKRRVSASRKVYAIDTAMIQANTLSHSKDSGRLLENLLFLYFRRNKAEICFYREQYECDFLLLHKGKVTAAVQSCMHLHSENMQRELKGLTEVMDAFNLSIGTIVTLKQDEELQFEGKRVQVVPAYNFLLK